MCIDTDDDLQGMLAAGRVVRRTLDAMQAAVAPGVTTADLDAVAARVFREHGARSAPRMVYDFPGETCISVNDEIVHGIPSSKRHLRVGDLVKLDVTAEKDGFMADACVTVPVGDVSAQARALVECAQKAFDKAMRMLKAGVRACDVGGVIDEEVSRRGFFVVRELTGHGIGRTIHEQPMVPNWFDPTERSWLTENLVITVEPIIAMTSGASYLDDDGWTIRTKDGGLAAHFEHTVIVTKGRPRLITAAA